MHSCVSSQETWSGTLAYKPSMDIMCRRGDTSSCSGGNLCACQLISIRKEPDCRRLLQKFPTSNIACAAAPPWCCCPPSCWAWRSVRHSPRAGRPAPSLGPSQTASCWIRQFRLSGPAHTYQHRLYQCRHQPLSRRGGLWQPFRFHAPCDQQRPDQDRRRRQRHRFRGRHVRHPDQQRHGRRRC